MSFFPVGEMELGVDEFYNNITYLLVRLKFSDASHERHNRPTLRESVANP